MICAISFVRGFPIRTFQIGRGLSSRTAGLSTMSQASETRASAARESRMRPQRIPGSEPRTTVKRKIVMFVAYDGAAYSGFQRNVRVVTVSDILEKALHTSKFISDDNVGSLAKVSWVVAARTDKGVCAASNAVSFKAAFPRSETVSGNRLKLDLSEFVRKVNMHLPRDVRVLGALKPTSSFSAKDACNGRAYEYLLPLSALPPNSSLDEFSDVLSTFEGSHFFHNYTVGEEHRIPPPAQASRYVTKCRCGTEPVWHRGTGENTAFARISIHGQSFMLHQIRKMIALAILLFTERVPPDSIRKSFDSSVLVNIPPAPAAGLFVDSILFDAYNKRFEGQLETPISSCAFQEAIDKFKYDCLYPSVVRRFAEEENMESFFEVIQRYPPVFNL